MKSQQNLTIAGIAAAVLIGVLYMGFAGERSATGAASPTQVQVVNSTSQAVPTVAQGTTSVSGSVSVSSLPAVTLAGTPSVQINNSSTVKLAGTDVLFERCYDQDDFDENIAGPVDVTPYSRVRVVAWMPTYSDCADLIVQPKIVLSTGQEVALEDVTYLYWIQGTELLGNINWTRVYDVPGASFELDTTTCGIPSYCVAIYGSRS